jgi:hypothetical protein
MLDMAIALSQMLISTTVLSQWDINLCVESMKIWKLKHSGKASIKSYN